MEQTQNSEPIETEQPQEVYVPRPMWQVWAARIGLVIMIISIALWLYHIAFPV